MRKILFIACLSLVGRYTANAQKPLVTVSTVTAIKAIDKKVFFAAQDRNNVYGAELWISDGTAEDTRLLKDINKGHYSSSPQEFTSFNGKLFFAAYTQEAQDELWTSDGTEAGTRMVLDLSPTNSSAPRSFKVFKNALYFTTEQGALYKTDGTGAGTVLVDQIAGNYGRITQLTIMGDHLYYYKSGSLQRTDGTTITPVPLPAVEPNVYMQFNSLHVAGNRLIALSGSSYLTHVRLHALNETATGWTLLKEYKATGYGDQMITNFTTVGDRLFYSFRTDYDYVTPTDELWVTDGTVAGTAKVKSFTWVPHSSGSAMENFSSFGGALYFRSGETNKKSLWKSDGTEAGTVKLSDAVITTPYNETNPPVISGGKLFFCGDSDLWSTDGTAEGTKKELEVNQSSTVVPYRLTDAGGILYFVTGSQSEGSVLWNTSPAPEIDVLNGSSTISNGGLLTLTGVLIDDCSKRTISLSNTGWGELMISSIQLTGKNFFLKGALPEVIGTDQKVTFDIFFNPLSRGKKEGLLVIRSNDDNESEYTIKLSGQTLDSEVHGFCQSLSGTPVKELRPALEEKTIALSKSSVQELQPAGTTVGTLTTPGWDNVTYALVDGKGAGDNALFYIEGSALKTKALFRYPGKKLYAVRVKATNAASASQEAFFTIDVLARPVSFVTEDCKKTFEHLDYGLLDIALNSSGELFTVTTDGRILRSSDSGVTWERLQGSFSGGGARIAFRGGAGYIVSTSAILKSEDNGANWFQLYFPTAPRAGFFFNETSGFVSGGGGAVFYTADGGQTWEKRKDGGGLDEMHDLQFWDPSRGLGLYGSSLMKTVDGGKTWTTIDLSSLGWLGGLRNICLVSDKDVFLNSASNLFRSKDGGATWTRVNGVSGSFSFIMKFADARNGYLYNGQLYKTTDGGDTWKSIQTPGPGTMTGLAMNDSQMFSAHMMSGSSSSGRVVSVSVDGGATWQNLQELWETSNYYEIDFPTEKTGFLLSDNRAYKTIDKGLSWKPLTWPRNIRSAYFINETTGLLSDGFKIYKTSDGGETVQEIFTSSDPNRVGELYPFDENVIFASNGYSIHRTLNGGSTWDLINTETVFYSRDMHFITASTGYRVDVSGDVQKTTDGGATWQTVYTRPANASGTFSAIYFVNEQTGYKAGSVFAKTTDGGVTWENIFTNLLEIVDLHFTDASHGFAISRRGTIHETSDGGLNWTSIPIYSPDDIYGAKFRHGNVYVCGAYGFFGQVANTASRPVQPGYVSGPETICQGDVQVYVLPEAPVSSAYRWQVSGGAIVEATGSSARIQFPTAGDYSITVELLSACGTSEQRTFSVKARELPPPVITGSTIVESGASNVRYDLTGIQQNITYEWHVTDGTISDKGPAYSIVNWKTQTAEATVSVTASDGLSGCRVRSDLVVNVGNPVSVSEIPGLVSVYPNPVEDELKINSGASYPLQVRLFDLLGKEYLQHEVLPFHESTLELRGIPAGLYLLELNNDASGKKIVKRIIKK